MTLVEFVRSGTIRATILEVELNISTVTNESNTGADASVEAVNLATKFTLVKKVGNDRP